MILRDDLLTQRAADQGAGIHQWRYLIATLKNRQLAIPALKLLIADQVGRQAGGQQLIGAGLRFSTDADGLGIALGFCLHGRGAAFGSATRTGFSSRAGRASRRASQSL